MTTQTTAMIRRMSRKRIRIVDGFVRQEFKGWNDSEKKYYYEIV